MPGYIYDNINLNPATLGSGQATISVIDPPGNIVFIPADTVGTQKSTTIQFALIGNTQTLSVASVLTNTNGAEFAEATLQGTPLLVAPYTIYTFNLVYERTALVAADAKALAYVTVDGNDIAVEGLSNVDTQV